MDVSGPANSYDAKGHAKARMLGKAVVGKVILGTWGIGILTVGAFLMAGHVVSLPTPAVASQRIEADPFPRRPGAEQRWSARHVLYQACGCSSRVLEHLLKRGARPDLNESVIFVRNQEAAPEAATLRATVADDVRRMGFRFESVTPLELEARYHIESAPLLSVFDPSGQARYVGGYTDRSGGGLIHDLDIVDKLRGGQVATKLPVFGCAISLRLQKAIDPLGLKYQAGNKRGNDE